MKITNHIVEAYLNCKYKAYLLLGRVKILRVFKASFGGGDGRETGRNRLTLQHENSRYAARDRVRVRRGIKHADCPDMPMGGWAGTISEIHKDGMYTIRWSRETLAAIHPVFNKRFEMDGLEPERY